MIKLIFILSLSFIDGTYTIDTHNYTFIRECFRKVSIESMGKRENIVKNILDMIDLFI